MSDVVITLPFVSCNYWMDHEWRIYSAQSCSRTFCTS